jgi:adenylate kinase
MANQIIKQPNGKYAIFSTEIDDFVLLEATPEAIIEMRVEEERKRITESVNRVIGLLEEGKEPYPIMTRSFSAAVTWIKKWHGEDALSLQELRGILTEEQMR